MEDIEKNTDMKLRGFRSCVATAMQTVFGNIVKLAKENWKIILPLILTMAVINTCSDYIMPGIMYVGFEFHGKLLMTIVILSLITNFLSYSLAYSIVNKQGFVWNIKRLLRLLPLNIAFVIAYIILGVAASFIYASLSKNPAQIPLLNILGIFLLIVPVGIIFSLPLTFINCRYMVEPKLRLRKFFKEGYAAGMRNWGFIFVTYFVATLCCVIIAAVLCSPTIIIQTVLNVSSYGTAAYGDPTELPSYFFLLDFMVSLYSSAIYMTLLLFATYTGYYVYQTIICKLAARNNTKNALAGNNEKESHKRVSQTI